MKNPIELVQKRLEELRGKLNSAPQKHKLEIAKLIDTNMHVLQILKHGPHIARELRKGSIH